jgi:2-oxoglutarate dehydrogenase E2 component (dihydrolipoamide succinyltransferase)
MKIVEMKMPQLGESILECTVLNWLIQPGDAIEIDDSVLEVATDKVDTEVPAPFSGKIIEFLVKEGDVVPIGDPVARIEVSESVGALEVIEVDEPVLTPEAAALELEKEFNSLSQNLKFSTEIKSNVSLSNENNSGFYSPLVLSIAKEEGLTQEELADIVGTGLEKRVTKADIARFLERRKTGSGNASVAKSKPAPASPPRPKFVAGADEIIEMDRMRKMISQRMLESKQISPHVTSFIETDVSNVVKWRNNVKDDLRKRTGASITFTPIFIAAVVNAIKEYPMINVSVDGDRIIKRGSINIGVAVALPSGNLIVPVIHNANQYDLLGLSQKTNELVKKARENKLTADDLAGGTFTISNIGTFGNIMGTPIIVQPQVAIMAFGAINKKPAVIETEQGDLLGIREKMFISHSYDHRVVDGSLGGMFLKKVSDYLEHFDSKQII